MINFVDDRSVFNGNLVDYKVISSDRILVDHGGGFKVQYNVLSDAKFDGYFGSNRLAAYGGDLDLFPNQRELDRHLTQNSSVRQCGCLSKEIRSLPS